MTSLPPHFVLRPARSEDVLAISSGALKRSVFVEDHCTMDADGLRATRGGLYCTEIFGALDGSLEDDRRKERFGHIELAVTLKHPWFGTPLQHLAVLPPGYRRFQRTPNGEFLVHDLGTLYGRLIASNSGLARTIELGAPEIVLLNAQDMLRKDIGQLFDNEGWESTLSIGDRPARSLSAHLGTEDAGELSALLWALGLVAEPKGER